jgi:hypothetical protein
MLPRSLFIVSSRSVAASLFFAIALILPANVYAQSASANLSGTVLDQNGAVVPSATVTISNRSTGLQRQVETSDQGGFTIPLLPPSTYSVRVERQGFSPVEVPDVVLNVGDNKALQIQLKAGDVNAQVTVDSDAETVRTDGGVGTVINRQQIANMPLNGRSLQALIQLTPGVVLTGSVSSTGDEQFSVNGQRTTSNYYMVDGVSANTGMETSFGGSFGVDQGTGKAPGTTALGGTNSLVSLDALQEFRIETSTFAPEFGRTPGGQISLVTRGGTNQFTGSVSEYFRNEVLDANDWFANANKLPKPKERQNLFGGVLGGPVYFPRFGDGDGAPIWSGKNRLFFFASYEGLRLKQPRVKTVTVPTMAVRASATPAFQPYLNAFPLPNGQDFGNGTAQFAASYSDPGTFNVFSLRLDGHVTDKLTGFFRFNHAPSDAKKRDTSLAVLLNTHVSDDSYTGGATWQASSRLTADIRVNWTRNAPSSVADMDTFGGAVVPNASDIFAPGRVPSNSYFQFSGPGGSFWVWGSGNSDVQRQFNAVGAVAWLVGSHQLKMGVDYRRLLPLLGATGRNSEFVTVNSSQQLSVGQLFLAVEQSSDPIPREPLISNLSLFAQDTWRASRRLTLTYGLRFERVPPPGEATGQFPRTLLGIDTPVLQNPRLAPVGTPLFRSRFGEFAPRLGVAYQLRTRPGWETTLRGGAGIYYDLPLGDIATAFQFDYPFLALRVLCCNLPFPLSPSDRQSPSFPLTALTSNSAINALAPNIRMPYTVEWNGAIEQGLGSAQSITVTYVGAAGRRLLSYDSYRTSLADFPNVTPFLNIQRNLSESSYKALQIQFRRRLQRGLQALASYTLGSSRDNRSTDSSDSSTPPSNQPTLLAAAWGPSNFDVRDVFSAAVTYEPSKLSAPKLLEILTRDWGVDILFRYQSALPITPRFNGNGLSFPGGIFFSRRPDQVPGQPLYIKDPTVPGGRRFNPAAFTTPAAGQQGNFPRNGLRAFPASQVDLALRRDFRLGERLRLQLRGELFNLFNHPNFGNVDNNASDGIRFGQPTQMLNSSLGGLNGLYQLGGPRSGQLAVKLLF